MSIKTRVYKTLNGYFKAIMSDYARADEFFAGRAIGRADSSEVYYVKPSDELRAKVAVEFEKFHWSKSNKVRLNALKSGDRADFSYLQCFYVEGRGKFFGNSLSGDAYEYCKRMFTKSAY